MPDPPEIVNQTRSGEEYWVSKDIQPLHDETGAIEGFVSVQTDITAQKQVERALAEARRSELETGSHNQKTLLLGDRIFIRTAEGHESTPFTIKEIYLRNRRVRSSRRPMVCSRS